jgi:hypothetical protein
MLQSIRTRGLEAAAPLDALLQNNSRALLRLEAGTRAASWAEIPILGTVPAESKAKFFAEMNLAGALIRNLKLQGNLRPDTPRGRVYA